MGVAQMQKDCGLKHSGKVSDKWQSAPLPVFGQAALIMDMSIVLDAELATMDGGKRLAGKTTAP